MTYSATSLAIRYVLAQGFVERHPHQARGTAVRRLFVTPEIDALLNGSVTGAGFPKAEAEVIIGTYCAGHLMTVSRERRRCKMERLEGIDEYWAMCFRSPRPGWRLFGRFVEQDVFVANAAYDRHQLGAVANYAAMAEAARKDWERRLPQLPALRADWPKGYLGGVVIDMDDVK